jgi:hypothetical protein
LLRADNVQQRADRVGLGIGELHKSILTAKDADSAKASQKQAVTLHAWRPSR